MDYLLKPQKRKIIESHFPDCPFCLINTGRYFEFLIDRKPVGFIGLSRGISNRGLLTTLFDCPLKIDDYYEIVRSYCRHEYKNMPSKMLGIMLRMLKKYSDKKFIYTTGAGYLGVTGRIYQAANFLYVGQFRTRAFYIKGVGYVHSRSFGGRYGSCSYPYLVKIFPDLKIRYAPIYRYLYFLKDREELMKHARFKILPYPKREEMKIVEKDLNGEREINYKDAYDKIVSLKANSKYYNRRPCVSGEKVSHPIQSEVGGSSPTLTLQ